MAVSNKSTKKRKKLWYGIYAPDCLRKQQLGESTVYNTEDLIGKTLKLNLSTFTNDMRKQNVAVKFSVKTVVDSKAITEITGISLTTAYIKRLVRRGRNKVDDSFLAVSKDKKNIRLKPIIITNAKTERSVTSKLRIELRKILSSSLKNSTSEEFFMNLINQRLQKEIKDKLSKIYPVKFLDVRQSYIVKKEVSSKDIVQAPDEEEVTDIKVTKDEEGIKEESEETKSSKKKITKKEKEEEPKAKEEELKAKENKEKEDNEQKAESSE